MKALHRFALVVFAALALVPAAEAASISCDTGAIGNNKDTTFLGAAYRCETEFNVYTPSSTTADYFFDFGFIANTLEFDGVVHDMVVTMSAFYVTPGNTAFLARVPEGYTPATFETTTGDSWVYFRVEDLQDSDEIDPPQDGTDAPPQNPDDFTGQWTQTIRWFGVDDTNQIFEMLHDNRPLDTFADVITVEGSFDPLGSPCDVGGNCFPPCEECSDPAIGGSADDFSDTLVVVSQVPEPATMLLLLTGLAGAGMERRRRNRARR